MKTRPTKAAKHILTVLSVLLFPAPSAPLSTAGPGPDVSPAAALPPSAPLSTAGPGPDASPAAASLPSAPLSTAGPGPDAAPAAASVPAITLRAASGATITFLTQNGRTIEDVPAETLALPHLVLTRNGALSEPDERTLILEVTGIDVPPAGVTVTLELGTQHRDPDHGELYGQGIPVWQASRRIANGTGITRTNVTATFVHPFGDTVASGLGTPTDYYRYDVTVTDANHPPTDPTHRFSQDYAFLMESQWIASLSEVREGSADAAPDELIVYYCDMFPFQRVTLDPATWLPREEATDYVGSELVPQMVEAFRIQTDEWGFPWHEAWTSYRPEDSERLSVALTDGRTWFHGWAPNGGHSGIALRVNGGNNTGYRSLTGGLVSTFHHELFHNLQLNINLNSGDDGGVGDADRAWAFFTEGTAVLAAAVGPSHGHHGETLPTSIYMSPTNPFVQYGGGSVPGLNPIYMWHANLFVQYGGGSVQDRNSSHMQHASLFVQYDGGSVQDLNTSYAEMSPYRAAIYWRYLYEQCGGMQDGIESPTAGMQVIRQALTTLYGGEVVDVRSSTDLVGALPTMLDQALAGSSCPFQTYEESLSAFARAIYALRLEGGRCVEPGIPAGCGFYDPYDQYRQPPLTTITYAGADQEYRDGIRGSFGIDLIEVELDRAADGQSLILEFQSDRTSGTAFSVQLTPLVDSGDGTKPRRMLPETAAAEIQMSVTPDGHSVYVIPAVDTAVYNRLGLIITRLDAREASDPTGAYTLVLHPGRGL